MSNLTSLQKIKFVETKEIPISKIKFDDKNPNKLSNEKNNALYHTVEKYGFAVDPWVNDTGDGFYLVIDGKHRIKMLIQKGELFVVCKIFKVSYVEVQMLRQVANKLRGQHDKEMDAQEFKSIFENEKLDEFAKMLGEPMELFQDVLTKNFDITFYKEEGPTPELPIKPKSKLGDIYQLGNHRIMCGDATNQESINNLLGNLKINLVATDPPYGVKYEQGKNKAVTVTKRFEPIINDEKQGDELREFIESVFVLVDKFCDCTPIYVCSPPLLESFAIVKGLINVDFKIQSQIIWYKNQFILGRADYHWQHEIIWYGYKGKNHYWCGDRTQSTVWEISKDPSSSYQHPTQKPVELFLRMIKNSSKKGMVIFDPFLGSGSSLIACEHTERICYGMELSPGYVDVIIQRWENLTGNKATKCK